MNRTKIEWCEYTWNPITGCRNGCPYCYARKIAMRFRGHFNPTFHPERLNQPIKQKARAVIFADSMTDFWGDGVKQEWRNKVYDIMRETPQHQYLLLTKQPHKINDAENIPHNVMLGVTVTRFDERLRVSKLISRYSGGTFVSLEPLLDNVISDYVYLADWLIVGAVTGVKNGFKPSKKAISDIIRMCHKFHRPLFLKDNLGWETRIQEFPEGMGKK